MKDWSYLKECYEFDFYEDEVCCGDFPLMFESKAESELAELYLKIDLFCYDNFKDLAQREEERDRMIKALKLNKEKY